MERPVLYAESKLKLPIMMDYQDEVKSFPQSCKLHDAKLRLAHGIVSFVKLLLLSSTAAPK
eukprot:967592-Pelagomonas_calceolata.AAC.1